MNLTQFPITKHFNYQFDGKVTFVSDFICRRSDRDFDFVRMLIIDFGIYS